VIRSWVKVKVKRREKERVRKETANDDRLWPVLTMRSGVDLRCGG
jgi:hypothetical protein